MSIDGSPGGWLRKLEALYTAPQKCQTCYGHPSRLTYADPDTGIVWWESLPESGCPECGRPIIREMRVGLPDDGSGEPPI